MGSTTVAAEGHFDIPRVEARASGLEGGGRGRGASGGTARSLLFKKQASRGPSTEPPTASNSRKSIPYVIIAAMARSTRRGGGGEDLWVERRFEKRKLSSLHCRGCWVLKACDL